jgi:transcriptional regulator with XRE-family HTH domain
MINIGNTLREEREKQNLNIKDIADKTLIRPYYIEEIENNNFPYYDGFIISYIRKYANVLNIEAEPLLSAYKELFKEEPPKPKRRINFPKFFIIFLISVALIVAGVFTIKKLTSQPVETNLPSQGGETNNNPPQNPSQGGTQPEQPSTPPSNETGETGQTTGIDLVLRVDQRSWFGVDIDGTYTQFFLQPGQTKELKANNYINIRYGNAKHVYVTKNGNDLGVVSKTDTVVEVEYKP